jgi:hypothetical protein
MIVLGPEGRSSCCAIGGVGDGGSSSCGVVESGIWAIARFETTGSDRGFVEKVNKTASTDEEMDVEQHASHHPSTSKYLSRLNCQFRGMSL